MADDTRDAPQQKIELEIRPPVRLESLRDDLPLESLWQQRQAERDDAEWEALGGTPIQGEQGLEEAAKGGKELEAVERVQRTTEGAVPPAITEGTGLEDLREGPVRQAVDTVLRTLTGVGLDGVQQAIERGTLPEEVRLKLLDPVGSVSEELAADTARKSGLDEELAQKIGGMTGLLLGMIVPGKARKPPTFLQPIETLIGRPLTEAGKAAAARYKQAKAALRGVAETAPNYRTLADDLKIAEQEVRAAAAEMRAGPRAMAGATPSRREGMAVNLAAVIQNIGDFNATRMTEGVVPHAETIQKAARAMPLEDALRLDVAKYDLATLQTAVAGHYRAAADYYKDVATRAMKGDQAAQAEYWGAFTITSDLAAKDALLGTQVGRGLEARKIGLEQLRDMMAPADLQAMAQRLQGAPEAGMTIEAHAARMLALPGAARKRAMEASVSWLRAGQDMLYEAWINALLSGPQTHVANSLSNAVVAAYAPVERFLAAAFDVDALAGQRSVYFGESAAMVYGVLEGFKDMLRLGLKEFGEFGPTKIERTPAITARAFGLNPETTVGGAVDFFGAIIRTPGKALQKEDELFKGFGYRMQLNALAYREAATEGLSGSAFWKRVRDLKREPDKYGLAASAQDFALTQTFTREFDDLGKLGGLGRAARGFAENVPIFGRTILPFTRTPTNLVHYASERVPVLAFLSDTIRADLKVGGERRALAAGKLAGGLMIGEVLRRYAMAPIAPEQPTPYMTLVTGEGPKDARMKAQLRSMGWQPYSVWNPLTKTYVSYNRLEPFGTILGITVSGQEILGQLNEVGALEVLQAAMIATQKAMISKTFLTGLRDFLDAMEGDERDFKRFFDSLARSGVPALARQTMRTLDPIRKDVDTLYDHWRSGLPNYDGPPVHNLWGDPIILPPGFGIDGISPLYSSEVTPDRVTEWMIRTRVVVPRSPRAVGPTPEAPGETPYIRTEAEKPVKRPPGGPRRLWVLIGRGGGAPSLGVPILPMGAALKDEIARVIDGPGTEGVGGSKADRVLQRVYARRRQAIEQLRRESPLLDQELTRRERLVIEQKTRGPAAPPPAVPGGGGFGDLLRSLGREGWGGRRGDGLTIRRGASRSS